MPGKQRGIRCLSGGPATNYEDEKKLSLLLSQENLSLFLNMQVFDVKKEGNKIISVVGQDIMSGKEYIFKGKLFSDCTGDGEVGFLAGADFRLYNGIRKILLRFQSFLIVRGLSGSMRRHVFRDFEVTGIGRQVLIEIRLRK